MEASEEDEGFIGAGIGQETDSENAFEFEEEDADTDEDKEEDLEQDVENRLEAFLSDLIRPYGFENVEHVSNGGSAIVFRCKHTTDEMEEYYSILKVIPLRRCVVDMDGRRRSRLEEGEEAERLLNSVMFEAELLTNFHYLILPSDGIHLHIPTYSIRFHSTPSPGFCCHGFIGEGRMRCRRCSFERQDHIFGVYPCKILMIDYRGIDLHKFALNLNEVFEKDYLDEKEIALRRVFEISYEVVRGVIEEVMLLWDEGYAHGDLRLENIAADDRVTVEDQYFGKRGVIVNLIDLGWTRSIDYVKRRKEPPLLGGPDFPGRDLIAEDLRMLWDSENESSVINRYLKLTGLEDMLFEFSSPMEIRVASEIDDILSVEQLTPDIVFFEGKIGLYLILHILKKRSFSTEKKMRMLRIITDPGVTALEDIDTLVDRG
eukprot:TRINITY_DN7219_c0_g1_i1.p1 TRINITY_DN7219_c0_g1~~TRINITY_DN7219_c0_g1_i1.p1  ORF type:complete len:431 (+),score=102.05 TRINITY_DN7219_c0_g1_i1:88-1380(+)